MNLLKINEKEVIIMLAHYGISAVRYNNRKTHIERVRVHEINNDNKASNPEDWTREDVVSTIDRKFTFVTLIKTSNGWKVREYVRTIIVNGRKYIRTDANQVESDNLENLPEY